ncbi:hypothetical protein K458DRAFT_433400 [Lentithecium fluviatile CBS 122367]|uniref:Uncharacterized protein n=1 Tax=Lentithecium fluviatile CBS 122367 TaxID=1168545 RepID=A0A6G1IUF1_9PLEO|nr:hypothetical protein K458DRAFT_433400 [Lentithecium fluviatile CBS 122367]
MAFRLVPFVFGGLVAVGSAHLIPQHGVFPRQAVSNSTGAPQTPSSTPTPTSTSSSDTSSITSTSTPNRFGNAPGSCPTSYAAGFPVETLDFTTQCESASARGRDDKYYYMKDTCLEEYCNWQWTSALTSYIQANITQTVTSTRTWFEGSFGTGDLRSYTTGTYTYILDPPKAISATAPCCGRCTLYAKTVDLYFWPSATETATPSVTGLLPNQTAVANALQADSGSYVDEKGFTFVSPSIYIGFTSLGATDMCGEVGTPLYNTTLAFDPTEVSSVLPRTMTATCITSYTAADGVVRNGTVLEGEDVVTKALTYSDVAQNCSTISGYYWFSDNPSSYFAEAGDPCHPVLAIPTKVNQLQKEWNNCGAKYDGGFYDPPKTLKQGPLLVPTTADPTPTADPGQSPGTGVPQTTAAPTALPETTKAPSTSQVPDPEPPATSNDPQPPVSTNDPVPDPTTEQSNPSAPTTEANPPPSSNDPVVSNPPASTTVQPDPTTQANPPQPGPSTTIVLNPPPANPTTGAQDPNTSNPPVLTLNPQPTTNPSDPNAPSNPSNPPVLTLVPTIITPVQSTANPQNPNPNPVPQPSGTAVIIGTQTLQPGSAITVGGTTTTLPNGQTTVTGGTELVLDPQGTQVIVDRTSTLNLPPAVPVQQTAAPVVVTVGDQTITAAPSGPIVIGTQTLLPGSTILVDGTTLSLAPSGSQLVVGSSTIPLTSAPEVTAAPVVVTLGSTTLTANSLTQFVLGSTTLTAGGTVTADGTTYVLSTNSEGSTMLVAGTGGVSSVASVVATATGVVGNSTSSGESSTSTSSRSSGGISSSSGSATPTESESSPAQATGAAGTLRLDWLLSGLFGHRES